MKTPAAQTKKVISFGPFSLVASERRLTKDEAPIELSARAFDILMTLLSRPSEVISKSDLMAQAWPGITVEEGSLRFHIANLRKALGDGKGGARYISTAAGRGYCFVAPVSRSGEPGQPQKTLGSGFRHANLPGRLIGIFGREDDLQKLSARLDAERFVTIVGSGGVGKTTLAVAIGHQLTDAFAGAVLFVDLSMLSDPDLVATVVASMLGLSVQSDDATPSLIAHLRDKRILLILDTCEHLIEAVAALAWTIFAAASQVHILATSRETLQVEGEHVYRLEPLECPPDDAAPTAAVARTFPATQLFLERARASGARLDFSDAEAAIVVSICRKLDGVALAIELAARRVEAFGVHQTAALLDQRLTLLWVGPRSAPPRQKTLQAMLDWSYGLLSEIERLVLRRLAVFVGHFTFDAALAVVNGTNLDQTAIFNAIDSLVAKSMVATRPIGAVMRYRLLDTTRAYALEIGISDSEVADLAVRHATYFQGWLEQSGKEWSTLSTGTERAAHFANLNNVRAALQWCFGVNGNTQNGIALAAAAAPVFLAMSLLPECHRWSERAILALDDAARGGPEEMHLQAALGLSLIFTRGESEAARVAVSRGLAIAEQRGDVLDQLQLLGLLHMFHHRIGDFRTALSYAKRSCSVSATIQDPAAIASAHCILGVSLHHMGDFGGARVQLEAAREHGPASQWTSRIYLGFDHHNWAGGTLARNLWLQGHPAQAVELAHQTVKEAARMGRPLTLSIALNCAVTALLWRGDLESAEEHTDWLISHAESHSLTTFLAVGQGFRGELAIRRGDAKGGIESLRRCLRELHAARYKLLASSFCISLVEGLATTGRFAQGIALIDERIGLDQADQALSYVPELLRVKGSVLRAMPRPAVENAEVCFMQSLELSRQQGARAWQLRTAIDLAAMLSDRGQPERARTLLKPVFEQFVEGFDTADLTAARNLLSTLG
jgi:predicted ATPase/DNA-binding winged helix-turn-helix (wHTH) protein